MIFVKILLCIVTGITAFIGIYYDNQCNEVVPVSAITNSVNAYSATKFSDNIESIIYQRVDTWATIGLVGGMAYKSGFNSIYYDPYIYASNISQGSVQFPSNSGGTGIINFSNAMAFCLNISFKEPLSLDQNLYFLYNPLLTSYGEFNVWVYDSNATLYQDYSIGYVDNELYYTYYASKFNYSSGTYTGGEYYAATELDMIGDNKLKDIKRVLLFFKTEASTAYSVPIVSISYGNYGNESAYDIGYDLGYDTGYDTGYDSGVQYADGRVNTGSASYNAGVDEGVSRSDFNGFFSSILNAPVNMLMTAFDFEILGVNVGTFIIGLLTLGFVVVVIRLLLG